MLFWLLIVILLLFFVGIVGMMWWVFLGVVENLLIVFGLGRVGGMGQVVVQNWVMSINMLRNSLIQELVIFVWERQESLLSECFWMVQVFWKWMCVRQMEVYVKIEERLVVVRSQLSILEGWFRLVRYFSNLKVLMMRIDIRGCLWWLMYLNILGVCF